MRPLATLALACIPLLAQSDTPQRRVILNLIATTNKGEPVTDLQSSEIHLKDEGKPRALDFFDFDGSRRENPAASGQFVNRAEIPPTVILFDRWNEQLLTTASAWNDIAKAFEGLEKVDRIYCYFLTNHGDLYPVRPLPPLDSDPNAEQSISPSQLHAMLDAAVVKLNGLRNVDALDPLKRINVTFTMLDKLGTQMATASGRKNLIWVTHGVPLVVRQPGGPIDFTSAVQRFSASANRAGISIYAVDQSAQGAGADPTGLSRATLQLVASLTGGRWLASGNAGEALDSALADARGTYRIAYSSSYRPDDKKEHKIHLESTRKNIRLLTIEGYIGNAPELDPSTWEDASFSAQTHSPFDATDIRLRVSMTRDPSGSAHFDIHVNPSDVLMIQDNGAYHGRIAVSMSIFAGNSYKGSTKAQPTDLNLTADQWKQAQQQGIVLTQDANLASATRVRVTVYDDGTHALGSVTIPLQ